jgi:CelD/BcsL family acetyltransferase involved in cellulose biosynthesis
MVNVTVCSTGLDVAADWDDLAQRASVNVFMHPIALNAAHATKFAKLHVLLAWHEAAEGKKLVGLWAFQQRHAPFWQPILAAPPYEYAFLSSPVVDSAFIDAAIPAFFDAIERHPALPKVVRLKYLDGDSDTYQAILKRLNRGKGQTLKLSERLRPFVSKEAGLKLSGSTRKKLRQDWNRLSALGPVDIANDRSGAGARGAFEVFLTMEANSWKGAERTALLCDDNDALFVRRLVGDLAARQSASVALLRVGSRPIAAQVLLYCGRMAYTWKTAFDPQYAKYSPGVLLVDKMTEQLFSTTDIEAIESCSPDGSFMNQLWAGRRTTVDLLAHVGARKSQSFTVAAIGERGYLRLRDLRNKIRAMRLQFPKRKGLAVSR